MKYYLFRDTVKNRRYRIKSSDLETARNLASLVIARPIYEGERRARSQQAARVLDSSRQVVQITSTMER